jgi:hypothetical protein
VIQGALEMIVVGLLSSPLMRRPDFVFATSAAANVIWWEGVGGRQGDDIRAADWSVRTGWLFPW